MIAVRPSTRADIGAIDALLGRSYPQLLKADYPPSALVTVLPLMTRAQPGLVASGRYWVAEQDGRLLGAGGWSEALPGGGRSSPHLRAAHGHQ